ncbi:MAG: hypothetical protein KAG95_04440 [Bacteroidales bacterium]|nr:hypothetical protein [Bacteroidales bacterium]
MIKKFSIILSIFFFLALNLFAQDEQGYLEVKGTAKSERRVIQKAKVEIYRNSVKVNTITTNENGKFNFKLDLNKNYIIKFVKKGLVSKKVSFVTIVPKDEIGIWTYRFSIDLFPMVEGLNISILENPIAKIKYNDAYGEFDFDEEYTQEMLKDIEILLSQYENLKQKAYEQTIVKADALFDNKKYKDALEMYDLATNYNPYEEYPDEMIRQIKRIVSKQESQKKSYDKAITLADKNFNIENFKQAKSYYGKALTFLPDEKYPKTKIAEIDKILGNRQANADKKIADEKAYKEYIASADKNFNEKKYLDAKNNYNKALEIKPNEQYPIYKLKELEKLISELQNLEALNAQKIKAFNEAIKQADFYFNNKQYVDAKTNYQKALSYKPKEKYLQDKINEINNILDKLKSVDEQYNKTILFADNDFSLKHYEKAKKNYQIASLLKPDQAYPKNKIAEINNMLLSLNKKEKFYKEAIKEADITFEQKQYMNSKILYNKALTFKPEEQYPKSRLVEIDKILAQLNEVEQSYQSAITSADQAFSNKNYQSSLGLYQKALGIKPNEQYPQNKIAEVNKLLADLKAKNKLYNQTIAKADKLFRSSKFQEAKTTYQQSLTYKPEEEYPKTKISEINQKLASLLSASEQKKAKEQAYKDAVAKGDQLFASEKYTQSKVEFERALTIKLREKYPKNRINDILKKLAELDKINKKYNQIIAVADNKFNIQKYSDAKKDYEKALEIKSKEQYPKDKIAEIEQIYITQQNQAQDKAKIEADYIKFIANADALFKSKQYSVAKSDYQKALFLKENEQYPKNQLLVIDKILVQQNAVEQSYQSAIASADQAFNNKNYQSSLGLYQKALGIKSTEQYPKQRVSEINNILADIQNKNNEYNKTVKEADNLFYSKKYKESKQKYEKALTILPNEKYPTQKISELIELIASADRERKSRQALQKQYDEIISTADKFFTSKNYDAAIDLYNQASVVLPKEQYPKTKINDINTILDNLQKGKIISYNATVKKADSYFNQKNFDEAKLTYNKALSLFPEKKYPKNQLIEISRILEKKEYERQKQLLTDKEYQNAIKDADKYFNSSDYVSAKAKYKSALNVKPKQKYPQDRIEKIDKIIQLQKEQKLAAAEKERQQKIDEAKAGREKDFDFIGKERETKFLSDLARKYPEGITVEHYDKRKKKIKRVIVNRRGVAKEYLEVKYSYGTYYFRNGRNISRYIFLSETKE